MFPPTCYSRSYTSHQTEAKDIVIQHLVQVCVFDWLSSAIRVMIFSITVLGLLTVCLCVHDIPDQSMWAFTLCFSLICKAWFLWNYRYFFHWQRGTNWPFFHWSINYQSKVWELLLFREKGHIKLNKCNNKDIYNHCWGKLLFFKYNVLQYCVTP